MSALSRKRRILDLALNLDSNVDVHITPNRNIHDENVNLEHEDRCDTAMSSPLPPQARSIREDMAEVWHDVFDNDDPIDFSQHQLQATDDGTHPGYQQVTLSPAPLIHNLTNDDVLTPLNIEVPSSFNNSPAIYLEEFEEPHVSTPSSSHLVLATPMPSPLNAHKKCSNVFCPIHCSWLDSVQCLGNTSVRSPKSALVKQKKSKKRLVYKENWSDVKRKQLKNLGKCYVSKRGKLVEDKVIGKPCNCRNECVDLMTEEQRLECFTRFWKLGSREKQWSYIAKYVVKTPKYRCLNRSTPNKRQYTFKYFLPLISANNEITTVNVCKTMFLQTLAVSESIIKTTFKKYDGVADIEEDHRGKHKNHKSVITNDMTKSVCDHVNSFVPVESHFIRKDSTKLYLDGSLSISRMYTLYNEWFDANVYVSKATTKRQYRDIVNKNFNLGFHIPKKDQCEVCHAYRNNSEPTNDETQNYERHMKAKKSARTLKQKDKDEAIESHGSIVTAVFDFEKVLTCPHGQISIFYYKRKLSAFNFTVFNMGKKKAVCYMWDETVAKRGANEVGSCLLDFIKDYCTEGAKEFRFWSDNCAGQNRNRFVFSVYLFAAKKYKVSITHRFLEKGHTQNEGDSVHALIERSSHSKTIYSPDEWRLLVRWAKTEGEPYLVKDMKQENFFNFKTLVNDKLWSKNVKKQKIVWSKIKEVLVEKSEPNKLYYKYDLDEGCYECLVIGNDTRRSSVVPVLECAYSSPLKLTRAKYKDLVSMCDTGVICPSNASFFRSLPYNSEDHNNEQDDDVGEKE